MTISQHILLGWKALLANFAPPPTIVQQVDPDDDDEDDDEDEDEDEDAVVTEESPIQTPAETGKRLTRFDRINNS